MFDWSSFLDVADELATRRGQEAWERTAISRAYYAAFHAARDYVRLRNGASAGGKLTHDRVWSEIASVSASISQDGRRLHGWRKNADYDQRYPGRDLSRATVAAIILARSVLDDIKRLP
ncbi:MAG: hypothetical protein ACRDJH_27650 [Thermomicrobiales bacterium]